MKEQSLHPPPPRHVAIAPVSTAAPERRVARGGSLPRTRESTEEHLTGSRVWQGLAQRRPLVVSRRPGTGTTRVSHALDLEGSQDTPRAQPSEPAPVEEQEAKEGGSCEDHAHRPRGIGSVLVLTSSQNRSAAASPACPPRAPGSS